MIFRIQIKPQLEKLLNLEADSLTKEIELTQDIMKLFVDHQIPSDLLSAEGGHGSSQTKLDEVRRNVQSIKHVIEGSRERDLEASYEEASFSTFNGGVPFNGGNPFNGAGTATFGSFSIIISKFCKNVIFHFFHFFDYKIKAHHY